MKIDALFTAVAGVFLGLSSACALPDYTAKEVKEVRRLPFFHFYPERTDENSGIPVLTAANKTGLTIGYTVGLSINYALVEVIGLTEAAATGGVYSWHFCNSPTDCQQGTVCFAYALDVNFSNRIVGYKTLTENKEGPYPYDYRYHAFAFDAETHTETDLTPDAYRSTAVAINDTGTITGSLTVGDATADETRAYRRNPDGTMTSLTALGDLSYGAAINRAGVIVGTFFTFASDVDRPFISISGNRMERLPIPSGAIRGYATAINDSLILGSAAALELYPVVWEKTKNGFKVTRLQDCLVTPNIILTTPVALNDQNQMIVQGHARTGPAKTVIKTYLLRPVK